MTAADVDVVVIGGGISGLVTAYRLHLAGRDVTLIEPDELGGKIRTSVFAGRPLDEGADAFLLRVPWALDLCRDLQIDAELRSPAVRTAYVWADGALRPLPDGQVLGVPTDLEALASSGVVSAAGVARAAEDLDRPADPADPAAAGQDVAIGPYLRRRLGDEVVDHLVDPLVGGINAGDTAQLSLAAVVPQLDAAARTGDPSLIRSCRAQRAAATVPASDPVFATPYGGMARLIDGLIMAMPALDVRLGRRVVELDPGSRSTFAIVTLDDGAQISANMVVIATPTFAAAALVRPSAPWAAEQLDGVRHASVALVSLAVARGDIDRPLDASGYLVPRTAGLTVTACSWATSKWAHLRSADDDVVLLRASIGRAGSGYDRDADDAALVRTVVSDLTATMVLEGDPLQAKVNRWPDSFPQYAPGHLGRVATIEQDLADRTPRLVLTGAGYRGLGVPACIRQANEAAARVLTGP
jgi:oxygen-dependent protoporphyrinogen oxidase